MSKSKALKPYQLWAIKAHRATLCGDFNTLAQLQRAWRRHHGSAALRAVQIVGGTEVEINDQMPIMTRELTEFRSSEERDQYIIENAIYFTVVRFLGVGQYERHERPSREEAITLGEALAKNNKANYLIYAVGPQDWSAYVTTMKGV